MSVSIRVIEKYGVSISAATYIQNNYWMIPPKHKKLLSVYYILSWELSYFKRKLQEGVIERNGISYQVIYYKTNPAEMNKKGGAILLSFRSLSNDYKVQPVVLITIANKSISLHKGN